MRTTQALAEITDAGLFERIATSVLRYAEPEIYGNVSHQGVNPQGKTVKAPLDNVGWYQSDDMIVCIAHTTTSKGDLEAKWLRDLDYVEPRKKGGKPTGTDGDLVKAIKEINKIRVDNPDIKAHLALAINCEENQDLRAKVEILASKNHIELDVWSVSRLADFLDIDPNGQIIRRNFLGIAPIRLSKQLLLEVGEKSLLNLNFDAKLFIERNFRPIHQNTLIVGVSGSGKTTYSIDILKRHLALQKPVLVLNDNTVKQALSIEEAIDIELRRYVNELVPQSGHQALELCSIDEPLMILVEDVNRSSDSARLLKKLIDWSDSNAHFILLCPVWHRLMASLSFEEKKSLEKHFKLEYLESYNEDEASRAIIARATKEQIRVDELSAANIAQQLGYDPLLISLVNLTEFHENANIIEEYIRKTIQSIAAKNDFIVYEVEDAINKYALHLFQNNKLQGVAQDLRALSRESQKVFKQVLNDGSLFRQSFETQDYAILSRHDRLNFYVIAKSIMGCLEDYNSNLTDPYFAEIIGISCALANLDEDKLYQISLENSLVAFHCYSFSAKTNSSYLDTAINNVRIWLEVPEHQSDVYDSQLYQSLVVLNDVLHNSVADILKLYDKNHHNPLFYQISFKQGSLSDGLQWISTYSFDTSVAGQKQIIDYTFNKYGEDLVRQVCDYLEDSNSSYKLKHHLLRLIGYTENTDFADAIKSAWLVIPDNEKDYRMFFWAVARVYNNDLYPLLESILNYWEGLSEEKNDFISDRAQFATYTLDFKFRDHIPSRSISYIVQGAYERPNLHGDILSLSKDIDHPDVLELQARSFADIEKKDDSNFGFTMFTKFFKGKDYKTLSSKSKERLLTLSNCTEDKFLRKKSFELWEDSPYHDDLIILQQIPQDDICYDTAVMGRAKRKDYTVIDELIEKISEDPFYWWQATRHIWHDKLEQLFEDKIAHIDNILEAEMFHLIDEIFEKLDIHKAEALLIRYWDKLSNHSKFIQIALMIATPKLQELVAKKLENINNIREFFEFIKHTLGIRTNNRKGITRYEQMKGLQPYFKYHDKMYLSSYSEICLKHGWNDISQVLEPLINEERYRRFVEINVSRLTESLKGNSSFVYWWISDRKKEGWSHQRTVETLFNWFEQHKSEQALETISKPLSESGKRTDYAHLESILKGMTGLSNKQKVLDRLYFNIYSRSLD